MEPEVSIRTINIVAALRIPTIYDAYKRIGVACLPPAPRVVSLMDRPGHFLLPDRVDAWQEQGFEAAM